MIETREKELKSGKLLPAAKQAIRDGIAELQLAISKHWDEAGKLEKASKQQPAKKAKETYADTSEIDGAEVFKDGDDYVVLYANGTKTKEFTSKAEADKFAKSLSKQPAKKKETSQEELKIKRNRGEISDQEYARKSKQKISRDDVADKSAGTGEILDQMLMIGGITQQERYRMDKMMEHHDIKPDDLINVLESGEYSPEQDLYTVLGYDEEPVLHMLDLAKKK